MESDRDQPAPESSGLPPHNPFAPHPPAFDEDQDAKVPPLKMMKKKGAEEMPKKGEEEVEEAEEEEEDGEKKGTPSGEPECPRKRPSMAETHDGRPQKHARRKTAAKNDQEATGMGQHFTSDPSNQWHVILGVSDSDLAKYVGLSAKHFTQDFYTVQPTGIMGKRSAECLLCIKIEKYSKPKVPYYGVRTSFGKCRSLGSIRMPMVEVEDGSKPVFSMWVIHYWAMVCVSCPGHELYILMGSYKISEGARKAL